jgi:KaiC/GvpD/RAD55 family RecA-like ATPase
VRKAIFGLVLVLIVFLAAGTSTGTSGLPSTPKRIFYLATSGASGSLPYQGSLTSSPPSSACSSCITNVTSSAATFELPTPLQSPATINGPLTVPLWVNWTGTSSAVPVYLGAAFSYRFPGQSNWANQNSTQQILPGPANVTVIVNLSAPLIEQSSIAIEVYARSVPQGATVWLRWGASSTRSLVVVPMSDYEGLFPANTITVQDRAGNTPAYFYLDAIPPNNYVVVKAFVFSALGIAEIQQGRVNMTIHAPDGHPVKGGTNETMSIATSTSPYELIASWTYSSNSTQGTYLVDIDMVDSQGNLVYSFNGPGGTFGLVPPGFIPFPYNLLPYFVVAGIGGIGGVGGIVYYRRKSKSYLAPFGHFNTLTAGEVDAGTVAIEGNTGSGKTILSEQLMFEDLKRGRPCIFVSTSDFPSNVRSGMKSMGLDVKGYEQSGLLTFVDGYSAEAGQESTEKFSVPSIGDLTTLGMKISSSIPAQSKGASLYFDSLVPLASKTKPESIVSFVQSIGAKMRGIGGKAVFTLGPSVDPMVQKQLEDMSDCVVQMEAFEERGVRRRRLKISKLRARRHQEGWNVFAIEDGKGIIFYSKKPKT